MKKKQAAIYALIGLVFVVLVYMQFRTWRNFDWPTFWAQTDKVDLWHVAHAVGLIYLAYVMRALRWRIFLQPVRPQASTIGLVSPTVVGFTGLAILGRPGELIRPYLIARRLDLSVSSQVAVWAVERIFDIGGFTILLIMAAFFATAPKRLSYYADFQKAGFFFAVLVVGLTLAAVAMDRKGEALALWFERRFAHAPKLAERIALRIREFSSGLKTIHNTWSLIQLIAISVAMWAVIAVAYKEVTHAYSDPALEIPQSQVLLLMGSSMVGSTIQLPGVGGGSQLATIAALEHIFDVPKELAASCGILLWLVTFVAVVPIGLFLAHREHLSLRKLSKESHAAEKSAVLPSPPLP